jgi:hypothetical protein
MRYIPEFIRGCTTISKSKKSKEDPSKLQEKAAKPKHETRQESWAFSTPSHFHL